MCVRGRDNCIPYVYTARHDYTQWDGMNFLHDLYWYAMIAHFSRNKGATLDGMGALEITILGHLTRPTCCCSSTTVVVQHPPLPMVDHISYYGIPGDGKLDRPDVLLAAVLSWRAINTRCMSCMCLPYSIAVLVLLTCTIMWRVLQLYGCTPGCA